MLILEASNIRKYYRERLIIQLNELKVYTGDCIGVVGQNGCGKTTLFQILAGEIQPDEGFVKRYCEIGHIRQFSEEVMEAAPKAIKELGLSHKTGQTNYSGGEKTRIKIANVFSRDHIILFADEPTSNLDYKGIDIL